MTDAEGDMERPQLRQELTSFQILCIVLSGLIGTGVFITDADALQLAGPGGLLLALIVLGVIAISVNETVSHLVQLFPAPNAIFEYVSKFVDRELAWVIGFVYWYAWTSVFATEMLTLATIIQYWNASSTLTSIVSYVVTPLILIFINTRHVKFFGWIETVGGILKVLLMVAFTIAIYHAAATDNDGRTEGPINVGITYNQKYTDNVGIAICMVLPLVAWSLGGIESTAMAAFEARPLGMPKQAHAGEHQRPDSSGPSPRRGSKFQSRRISILSPRRNLNLAFDPHRGDQDMQRLKDIAWASSSVHWIAFVLYLFYSLAIALTVPWNYLPVPSLFTSDTRININFVNSTCGNTSMAIFVPFCNNTSSAIQSQPGPSNSYSPGLASFVNGCLLYIMVSCGNTALYMASRTLYGLVTNPELEDRANTYIRGIMRTIGSVDQESGVPIYAVVLSYGIFCWVPWLGFKDNEHWVVMSDVRQFLLVTSSMAYVVVWAALCLAFLRFWYWTRKCADGLDSGHQRFCHANFRLKYRQYVRYVVPQPLAAAAGLTGCLLLIIMSSSVWWKNSASVSNSWTVGVYFIEGIVLLFWAILKWASGRKRLWVHLDSNPSMLQECLDDLVRAALGGLRRREEHELTGFANGIMENGQAGGQPVDSYGISRRQTETSEYPNRG